jgi:DNA-binding transcriptional ArsR family regulator
MKTSELNVERLENVANMLKAIAHPMRIAILNMLEGGKKLTVSEIHQQLGIEQAATSHHLGILKDNGVYIFETRRKKHVLLYKNDITIKSKQKNSKLQITKQKKPNIMTTHLNNNPNIQSFPEQPNKSFFFKCQTRMHECVPFPLTRFRAQHSLKTVCPEIRSVLKPADCKFLRTCPLAQ